MDAFFAKIYEILDKLYEFIAKIFGIVDNATKGEEENA